MKSLVAALVVAQAVTVVAADAAHAEHASLAAGDLSYQSRIVAMGDRVNLADFVSVPSDPVLGERLATSLVVRAPRAGTKTVVPGSTIARRLRSFGVPEAALARMPERFTVRALEMTVSAERVRAIAAEYLQSRGTWDRDAMELDVRFDDDVVLRAGRLGYSFRSMGDSDLMGLLRVGIDFEVDGEPERTVWVQARVKVFEDVVYVTTSLRRNARIEPSHVSVRRMDVSRLRGPAFRSVEEVIGQRTQAQLEPGTVLYGNLVDMPPLVNRGSLVNLVIQTSTIDIATLGEVQQRGRQGDMVRVENVASGKMVFGRVVDSQTVEVKF